jgi:dipeptidyl aminopeptidase/acylaminoacyl peptidase
MSALDLRAVAAQSEAVEASSKRPPTLADMPRLREFEELAVSPDGLWAAYTMGRPFGAGSASEAKRTAEQIRIVDLRRQRSRTITANGHPHGLRWSQGGSRLAFIARDGSRSSLWTYDPSHADVGPRVIAGLDSLGGDVLALAWSATGKEIAYLAEEPSATNPPAGSSRPSPRLVVFRDSPGNYTGPTSPLYSRDSSGVYVAVVAVGTRRVRTLARHLVSNRYGPTLDWSSTGRLLVSGAPIGVIWLEQLTLRRLYTLDPATGATHQVHPERKSQLYPVWSRSGRWIAEVDYESLLHGGPSTCVLRLENPVQHAELALVRGNDDPSSCLLAPAWGNDDSTLYVVQPVRGTNRLFAVDAPRNRWRAVTPESLSVSLHAVSRDGATVLAVLESGSHPPELFRIAGATGELTQLTHESAMLPPMQLGSVEELSWPSGDGRFTVYGFLVKPTGYDPARRYPLIVIAHGGPGALYMNTFVGINFPPYSIPPQLLAAAGYLVLLPNPRGDPSYGVAYQAALSRAWGTGPFGDIDAGVSMLIARGIADPSALGIAGASYGGYLTAFTIAHSHRFAAASINDAPVDLTGEYGQNYATHSPWSAYFGGTPWKERALYMAQSPITNIEEVRTPVLMRYGGRSATRDNIRQAYMLAQGFELYAALHDLGVPVRFLLHPDQGHGVTDWKLYENWIGENLKWFGFWLLHEGSNPVASGK